MKDLPPIKVPSNKNFPLPVTDSPLTWETYISILYTTLGYQEYTNQAYTSAEYNQFIEILKQSVIQDDTFYKQKMDYFDVHRINISLLSSSLPPKLDKLTRKTVRVINEVYPKLHNKQRLFIILNDYLQKQ